MAFSDDPRKAVWEREFRRMEANELPPNWDNPPKRHHYVPEMYLKRFAAPGRKRTPRLIRVDKTLGSSSRIVLGVHDAAVETDFYSVATEDPRRVHEAEHIIGVFESAAGYAFANFDANGPEHFPDAVDRENLSFFMALQYARGHRTGELQTEALTKVTRMIMRMTASSPERVRSFLEQHGDDGSDESIEKARRNLLTAAEVAEAKPHKNTVVRSILTGAVDFLPYFQLRRWAVGRSQSPLLTSDQPVVLLPRPGRSDAWRGIGVATADHILYPLDRHRVLIMGEPNAGLPDGVVDIGIDQARAINTAVANRARRWIFHHPDDDPLGGIPFNPAGRPSKP